MLKKTYLVLSILGLALTWYYNVKFMGTGGGLWEFIQAPAVSYATQSLAFDLFIATIAGSTWMVAEGRRLKMKHSWIYIALSFVIAFAFAFPLFLFNRQRVLERNGA